MLFGPHLTAIKKFHENPIYLMFFIQTNCGASNFFSACDVHWKIFRRHPLWWWKGLKSINVSGVQWLYYSNRSRLDPNPTTDRLNTIVCVAECAMCSCALRAIQKLHQHITTLQLTVKTYSYSLGIVTQRYISTTIRTISLQASMHFYY